MDSGLDSSRLSFSKSLAINLEWRIKFNFSYKSIGDHHALQQQPKLQSILLLRKYAHEHELCTWITVHLLGRISSLQLKRLSAQHWQMPREVLRLSVLRLLC